MFSAASKAYSPSDVTLSASSDSPVTENGLKSKTPSVNTNNNKDREDGNAMKKIHILLVEDSFINQKVAKGILSNLGYLVDIVENGQEALDAVEKKNYDLVIMDCQMPVMDGYTATEEIRKREQITQKHITIIAHTAHAMTYDREKCLQAGMDDYISKPVTQTGMKEIVEKWLTRQTSEKTMREENRQESILDLSVLEDLFALEEGEQSGLLKELFDYYVESTPPQFEEIRLAVNEKDSKKLERIAHALKGSSNSLGIKSMASLCQELELKGRTNSFDGVENLLVQLEPTFLVGSKALGKIVEEGLRSPIAA